MVTFLRIMFQLLLGVIGDVLSGDDHAPGIRLEESHDVMQRHRFAHAAAPQNAYRLRRQHVEADVVEHDVVAKRLGDVAKLDVGRGFCVVRHECSF